MKKGQKSVRGGIQDFLMPFTDVFITQGSDVGTHKGNCAVDIRGAERGVRYDYYAPCDVKCIKTYPSSGQSMWQSTSKVRFANGKIDYATFMLAHDDNLSANAWAGKVVVQGDKLGTMGTKGNATGVHCHIEIEQGSDTTWYKNKYGVYQFNNEKYIDDCCFVDNTNIIYGMQGNWRITSQVPVEEKKYVNLPPTVDKWAVYDINVAPVKKNAKGSLNPMKFGGLSYYVYEFRDNGTTAVIKTANYGKVKIYIQGTPAKITTNPTYKYGNY